MAYLNWSANYSVKVKRLDEDHQQLFDILNQLHSGMKSGQGKAVLKSVLAQLMTYTEQHFAREEALLKSRSYPGLRAHMEQHRAFAARIKEVSEQQNAGATGLSIEVLELLTQWLAKHIVGTDQQYSEFLNARGVV